MFKELPECGDMHNDMLKLIAAQGKPTEIVRDVLTNTDIARLLKK